MEFAEKLSQFKEKVNAVKDKLKTEEATKNALIMPFLSILGYDVFNPLEVVPEFIADSRFKKDEKIDYAIMRDNKPIILVECKKVENDKLDVKKHAGQLFKYFTACRAKFIILTNGIVYKFFTDSEEPNILDKEPYFVFNLLEAKDEDIKYLTTFCRENFDIDTASSMARNLKSVDQFVQVIESEYKNPSDDFVKYLLDKSEIYNGVKTSKIIEKHRKTTVDAFNRFMSKIMKTSLDFSAISQAQENEGKNEIVTTLEELEGFAIIKALLVGNFDINRVTYRDNASYFNVLLDDNIRKTICRLHFNRAQKYISFLEGTKDIKTPINNVNEIFSFKKRIIEKINEIEANYTKK